MKLSRILFAGSMAWIALAVERSQAEAPTGGGVSRSGKQFLEHVDLDGYFRFRGNYFNDLGLGWAARPHLVEENMTSANMRLRMEPSIRTALGVSVYTQIDLLDNLVLGSTPAGLPRTDETPIIVGTPRQEPPSAGTNAPSDSVRVKRAYAEIAMPFGSLTLGRHGALVDWGTGFLLNSGDHIDSDYGDSGDRIALGTPLFGHVLSFVYEISASGPTSAFSLPLAQPIDFSRRDDVTTLALAFARYDVPLAVKKMREAKRRVFQYALLASTRCQDEDIPNFYVEGELLSPPGASSFVRRDARSYLVDAWLLDWNGDWRWETEWAVVRGRTKNASLDPGVILDRPVGVFAYGGVLKAQRETQPITAGGEIGLASGDARPGFGAFVGKNKLKTLAGDLDGPQIAIPNDHRVTNFRFNPDYHVDLIFWRNLVGLVTDAIYVKPSARYRVTRNLSARGAVVHSTALYASTTPGGRSPLGLEADLGTDYAYTETLSFHATYGVLFPFAGLNPIDGRKADVAQAIHFVLGLLF